ncbi:MAG: Ppx/GppA family phosphatase [Deltaproteobacteria bacterium]|nr:MAG: Ppx/GppA family phosphatase [Deltaproteobacteria bacterium]
MRLASIDVGTNTLRLLIADVEGGKIKPVLRDREITGLGRSMKEEGSLSDGEIEGSLRVLARFREKMTSAGVERYFAAGTQALREAKNSKEFLRRAEKEAGVRIRVIAPGFEASLTALGISSTLPDELTRDALYVDIGGGSTEFIHNGRRVEYVSTPVGVVYLTSLFPLSDPPEEWELLNLRLFVRERLERACGNFRRRKVKRIVGTAGTYTTLAALKKKMKRYDPEMINGTVMSRNEIEKLQKKLLSLTSRERLHLPGMEAGREVLIVPGVVIATEAMDLVGVGETVVSDGSLLEGALLYVSRDFHKGVKV